jgi:dienelactone hydrolase
MRTWIEDVRFPSRENMLIGRLYSPEGDEEKPAVVICHGFPGNTKNYDLAEELALNGYVSLVFHPQGAWGSTGEYRLTKLWEGARDAIAYLRSNKNIDGKRIGLVGHSMGNLALSKAMSVDPSIKAGVLMAPPDLSVFASNEVVDKTAVWLRDMAGWRLSGVTVEGIKADLSEALRVNNPLDLVSKIRVPLMVMVGARDTRTTPEKCRLIFDAANEPKRWVQIEGADHDFSEHRVPMIRAVLERLREIL